MGKEKNTKNRYGDKVFKVDFIHCGDTQGSIIEKSIKNNVTIDDQLEIITEKNDFEESCLILLPNIRLKAELHDKMKGIIKDILSMDEIEISPTVTGYLEQITTPVYLLLFISQQCPYCPKVIKDVTSLAVKNNNIYIEIIDGILNDEKAKKCNIRSVPTLIFNENFRWTGQVHLEQVAEAVANVDPERLSVRSLQAMIESGSASSVAALMIERGKIFNSLYELLIHEKWSVRLGAMVVAEEVGRLSHNLSIQLMERLWTYYGSSGESIKGDMVYLAGELGSSTFREKLEKIVSDQPSPELLEAVIDALDTMKTRLG